MLSDMVFQSRQHEREHHFLGQSLVPSLAQRAFVGLHVREVRVFMQVLMIVDPPSSRIQEELAVQDQRMSAFPMIVAEPFTAVLHRQEYCPMQARACLGATGTEQYRSLRRRLVLLLSFLPQLVAIPRAGPLIPRHHIRESVVRVGALDPPTRKCEPRLPVSPLDLATGLLAGRISHEPRRVRSDPEDKAVALPLVLHMR